MWNRTRSAWWSSWRRYWRVLQVPRHDCCWHSVWRWCTEWVTPSRPASLWTAAMTSSAARMTRPASCLLDCECHKSAPYTHTHHALQKGFSLIFCQWVYLLLPTGQLWPVWVCCMSNWADYSSTRLKRPWQTFWKPWRTQRYVWLHTSMWFTVQPITEMCLYFTVKNQCEKCDPFWPIVWRTNYVMFWIITCSIFYFDHHKMLRTCQLADEIHYIFTRIYVTIENKGQSHLPFHVGFNVFGRSVLCSPRL